MFPFLCVQSIFAQSKDSDTIKTFRLYSKEQFSGTENLFIGSVFDKDSFSIRLQIQNESGIKNIPFSSITKIDLKTGQGSYAKRGFFIGLAIGSLCGFASSASVASQGSLIDDETIWITVLAAGLTGGLIGSMIGESMKRDRWERITFEQFRKMINSQSGYYPIMRFQFPLR